MTAAQEQPVRRYIRAGIQDEQQRLQGDGRIVAELTVQPFLRGRILRE